MRKTKKHVNKAHPDENLVLAKVRRNFWRYGTNTVAIVYVVFKSGRTAFFEWNSPSAYLGQEVTRDFLLQNYWIVSMSGFWDFPEEAWVIEVVNPQKLIDEVPSKASRAS